VADAQGWLCPLNLTLALASFLLMTAGVIGYVDKRTFFSHAGLPGPLAMVELTLVIAIFMHHFRVPRVEEWPPSPVPSLSLRPDYYPQYPSSRVSEQRTCPRPVRVILVLIPVWPENERKQAVKRPPELLRWTVPAASEAPELGR
jgi:hypothetical protein